MEIFKYLPPIQSDYRLIASEITVDEIQQLEKSLFLSETFSYDRDFFSFPFRKGFDDYRFLEGHYFFRREPHYNSLIKFLEAIDSSSFFISAPAYCTLYPLEISVKCPFSVYKGVPSYAIEEMTGAGTRPLQHPMYGVGFVTSPRVFVFDQSRKWAILLSDNVTDLATVGLSADVKKDFREAFQLWPSLSALQIIQTPTWTMLSPEERETFRLEYES